MAGELVALCTCPPDKADDLASALVEANLAACVNVLPEIKSIYKWEGKINRDGESLLIIKTNKNAWLPLKKRIEELHPYDVPEIICLEIEMGNESYLTWLNRSVAQT